MRSSSRDGGTFLALENGGVWGQRIFIAAALAFKLLLVFLIFG